jgi:hypothetical protein
MIYGIAISDFNTVTDMAELRKDIEMFNPKLRLTTLSRWVTPRENRIRKIHRSVILSFDNEEMHQWSLRGKLFVNGIPCHTRDFKETYYYYSSSSISACSLRAGTDNIHVCAPL